MSDYSWEPDIGHEPPEPCQYCSIIADALKEHDGTCNSLTKEQWIKLTEEAE